MNGLLSELWRTLAAVLALALVVLAVYCWGRVTALEAKVARLESELAVEEALAEAHSAMTQERHRAGQLAIEEAERRAGRAEARIARLLASQPTPGQTDCEAAAGLLDAYRRGAL